MRAELSRAPFFFSSLALTVYLSLSPSLSFFLPRLLFSESSHLGMRLCARVRAYMSVNACTRARVYICAPVCVYTRWCVGAECTLSTQ